MRVFTLYQPCQFVRLWVRSWQAHNFTTKLISEREYEKHGSIKNSLKARGGKFFVPLNVLNFSYRRPRKYPRVARWVQWGDEGWETAELVSFPWDWTEEQILKHGRNLILR